MRGVVARGIALFAVAAITLTSVACTASPSSGSAQGVGAVLVESKCTLCHTIDRIDQANKNRAGWEATVTRMRAHGVVLSDAEAAQVVDFLSQSGGSK